MGAAGDKVGASEATLLNMLNVSPFTYGLIIEQVYDSGTVFEPSILDITDDDLRKRFMEGETIKEYLKDPSKFAAAVAVAAPAAEEKKEEKKVESESEEEDDDMGFGLFD